MIGKNRFGCIKNHYLKIIFSFLLLTGFLNAAESPEDPGHIPGFQREMSVLVQTSFGLQEVPFYLYTPPGYGIKNKSWPMVLFLHGKGEYGSSLRRLLKWGPPRILHNPHQAPFAAEDFVVVSPLTNRRWDMEKLDSFLETIIEQYQINDTRVHLTGLSIGGTEVLKYCTQFPQKVASASVFSVDLKDMSDDACDMNEVYLDMYHNNGDYFTSYQHAQNFHKRFKDCSGKGEFTLFNASGHESWQPTYLTTSFWEQKLGIKKDRLMRPIAFFENGNVIEGGKVDLWSNKNAVRIFYQLNNGSITKFRSPIEISPQSKFTVWSQHPFLGQSDTTFWDSKKSLPRPLPQIVIHEGLNYQYYEGTWTSLPDFSSINPISYGVTNSIDPSQRISDTKFAMKFEGYFYAPTTGEYTFHLESRDGSRLEFIDKAVLDNDGVHKIKTESIRLDLEKGFHPLRAYFFNLITPPHLQLSFEGPGMNRAPVTSENLRYIIKNSSPVIDVEDEPLRLLDPIGGERLSIGDTMNIRWVGDTSSINSVQIFLSPDNATTWLPISSEGPVSVNSPEWGKKKWVIQPSLYDDFTQQQISTDCNQCWIMITDYAGTVHSRHKTSFKISTSTSLKLPEVSAHSTRSLPFQNTLPFQKKGMETKHNAAGKILKINR